MISGYMISDDKKKMNIQVIHAYIVKSYWAKGIPIETLCKALENSLCFGVFTATNEQVGFARMITDQATFAYLADVFIDENHRGLGLSKWLMNEIHQHPSLTGLRRTLLATRDAHGLYKQYGYLELNDPTLFMEKWNPTIYSS